MQKIAFVLLCLACAGHGRHMRPTGAEGQDDIEAIARLLLSANPSSAFNPSGSLAPSGVGALARQSRVSAPQMPAGTDPSKIREKPVWVSFAKAEDVGKGDIVSGFQYGLEIAIVCTNGGKLFAISNKLPPTAQPATLGEISGEKIIEPLSGSEFDLKTGNPTKWCSSLIGSLLLGRLISAEPVLTYPVRKQGSTIQVLINVNERKKSEATYWRGILDAQGKVDGGYF